MPAPTPTLVPESPASPHRWQPWFFGAGLLTLVLDLISKQVLFGLPPETDFPSWIRLAVNPGVAWSMLADWPLAVLGLTLLIIPVLVVVWWTSYRREGAVPNLAFGMVLGGALGNAVDRVAALFGLVGGVRDFLHVDLGFWPLNPWPTFNIADSGICVGFALVFLLPLFQRRKV